MRYPWIVMHQDGHEFHCQRCGQRDALRLPASLNLMIETGKAFMQIHSTCKEPR